MKCWALSLRSTLTTALASLEPQREGERLEMRRIEMEMAPRNRERGMMKKGTKEKSGAIPSRPHAA